MVDNTDWRLQGQEQYLQNEELVRREYKQYSKEWDHDHCEFCSVKFTILPNEPDAQRVGYCTRDEYRWICDTCFTDFRERFGWTVRDSPD